MPDRLKLKPKRINISRGGMVTGPAVTGDAVYAGIARDVAVRLDRRELEKVWEVDSGTLRIGATIDDAYVTVGGPDVGGVRSAADGRLLWTAGSRLSGASVWRAWVVIDSNAGIELRDPATGEPDRVLPVAGGYRVRDVVCGRSAILQTHRIVKAFDLEAGEVRWERSLVDEMQDRLGNRSESEAVRMAAGSLPDTFIAFHAGATFACSVLDGSILWQRPEVASPNSWPVVHAGRVYSPVHERFRAIDEATGDLLYDIAHPELDRIAYREKMGTVFRDRIAVAYESGVLAVFNVADGALVQFYQGRSPLWRTAEADGRLLVATGDGALLVFDESIWG